MFSNIRKMGPGHKKPIYSENLPPKEVGLKTTTQTWSTLSPVVTQTTPMTFLKEHRTQIIPRKVINKQLPTLMDCTFVLRNDGLSTFFSLDTWLLDKPLQIAFAHLFHTQQMSGIVAYCLTCGTVVRLLSLAICLMSFHSCRISSLLTVRTSVLSSMDCLSLRGMPTGSSLTRWLSTSSMRSLVLNCAHQSEDLGLAYV